MEKDGKQWMVGKTFDTFAPLGPWIETDLGPSALSIIYPISGVLMAIAAAVQFTFVDSAARLKADLQQLKKDSDSGRTAAARQSAAQVRLHLQVPGQEVMTPTAFPPLPPGSTIGMLGSGQLGRMFAYAAHRLGYRVYTFSPDSDSPLGQTCEREFIHDYNDLPAVREFARTVDVVTYEFENVPAETLAAAAEFAPARPSLHILQTTQQRLQEKNFLADIERKSVV